MDKNRILKKIWNHTPQRLRNAYLDSLLSLKFGGMGRKPVSGPLYIAGAFRSNSGMGRGVRLYAYEMAKNARPHYRLDITEQMRMTAELMPEGRFLELGELAGKGGGMLIIHANPPQFQLALRAFPVNFLKTVHIRAYWAWELEELPPVWIQGLNYADSLECPSHFCRRAFARHSRLPVITHGHAVPEAKTVKKEFCKDGKLRCLFIFDAGSSLERKNPQAIIEAFGKAFGEGEAEMTFKISHASSDLPAYRDFKRLCASNPDIKIIEETIEDKDLAKLYLDNDVYISLHRSEGFGLTLREALSHGLYVVATGWSGNMDFMKGERCYPVPYKLVKKRWRKGAMAGLEAEWAEADIDACAQILRDLRKKLRSL